MALQKMDYLEAAIKAARLAGGIHKRYFGGNLLTHRKSASFDLLTIADTKAEQAVAGFIKKHFPGHNILAEEAKYTETPSEFTWIVDPLDGTNNFVAGLPIFCASVALCRGNEVIAAAVYDATRDELFYAGKGKGAFLNRRRIRVNMVSGLKESLLITGFYYSRGKEMIETLKAIKRFLQTPVLGVRRLGAAALDLCYVACGRAAGFWEFQLSPWDFAAGLLIIKEAGGKITGRQGERVALFEKYFVVASNGRVHAEMLGVINTKEGGRI